MLPSLRAFAPLMGVLLLAGVSPSAYREPYRPQYHFTPAQHWMNDPNGLVFDGRHYHLFYQHNPFGLRWGHMSWGHATSRDLVHWQPQPLALPEADSTMIFSGSVVIDHQNTSGFGSSPTAAPMVAIYTAHRKDNQAQALAYSNDGGITWTKYARNPVLDIGKRDFRDPKVWWHAPTNRWLMVLALPHERQVRFYASPDLKAWQPLSDFGPAGDTTGIWECPDLFELPVVGQPGVSKWVLMLSVGHTMQYFVGTFDGRTFRNDNPATLVLRPDDGPDYYAAVTYNHTADRVSIGWMNNWAYANDVPTQPWCGAMALPRQLSLRPFADGIRLVQQPVAALTSLRTNPLTRQNIVVADTLTLPLRSQTVELEMEWQPNQATEVGIKVARGAQHETTVGYQVAQQTLFVDRTRSGNVGFHAAFAGRYAASMPLIDGKLRLRVFVDRSSVEVFAQDGRCVLTCQIFPDADDAGIQLYATGGSAQLRTLRAWPLRSIWRK